MAVATASPLSSRPRLPSPFSSAAAHPCRARLMSGGGGGRLLSGAVRCEAQRDDAFYMRRCVELARKAVGHTSPNPMVGCVIVHDGEVVGEGFHPKAGQPHAEVFALRDAGDLAENATAYVSLEPCNHYGRTPPCTEAFIRAKVKEVVVGMIDPNPIVASKGLERLRGAGIDIRVGVEEALCRKLNVGFIHRMLTGRPFTTLRSTLSINGSILNKLGRGADESGGYYSQLLMEYDGVIMSSNLAKTSTLPVSHENGANQPLYIIIASRENSPLLLPFLTEESATKVVVLADNPVTVESAFEGVEVVVLEQMNLGAVLEWCTRRGLCSVLLDFREVEGSFRALLDNCYDENLIQKVVVELLPVMRASEGDPRLAFGGKSVTLENLGCKMLNGTVLLEGRL